MSKKELELYQPDISNDDDGDMDQDDRDDSEEMLDSPRMVNEVDGIPLIKGPWTPPEDDMLARLVAEFGPKDWSKIAQQMTRSGRCRLGKQCRERWFNHLSPDVRKDAWTPEEDEIIIDAHNRLGNKWTAISKLLDGRPANAIKNHWNSTLKRRLNPDPNIAGVAALATSVPAISAIARKKRKNSAMPNGTTNPKRRKNDEDMMASEVYYYDTTSSSGQTIYRAPAPIMTASRSYQHQGHPMVPSITIGLAALQQQQALVLDSPSSLASTDRESDDDEWSPHQNGVMRMSVSEMSDDAASPSVSPRSPKAEATAAALNAQYLAQARYLQAQSNAPFIPNQVPMIDAQTHYAHQPNYAFAPMQPYTADPQTAALLSSAASAVINSSNSQQTALQQYQHHAAQYGLNSTPATTQSSSGSFTSGGYIDQQSYRPMYPVQYEESPFSTAPAPNVDFWEHSSSPAPTLMASMASVDMHY